MNGDAIARPDAARRQSARKLFGLSCEPLVSPRFVMKDEGRASGPGLRLMHQGGYWSHFHWLVSLAGMPGARLDGPRYRAVSVSGKRLRS
jgi:hypothetical protein